MINLLWFSSCRKCKDTFFCEMPLTGEKYFKHYKAGTCWIYYNQDSTKTDSVYVLDYKSERKYNKTDGCNEWDRREMKIISNYLSSKEISCLYENPNCDKGYFVLQGLNISVSIETKTGVDTLYSTIQNSNIITLDSLQFYNNLIFHEVVKYYDKLWFAPDFGLIQYISYNDVDTFYIDKFYIQ